MLSFGPSDYLDAFLLILEKPRSRSQKHWSQVIPPHYEQRMQPSQGFCQENRKIPQTGAVQNPSAGARERERGVLKPL